MLISRSTSVIALAVALTACSDPGATLPTEFTASFSRGVGELQNFSAAPLSGDQEVPARTTPAEGQARFTLARDGASIEYHLSVEDITNVHMAHIHVAPRGANGPVVVWLYPSTAPGAVPVPQNLGSYDGRIAAGVITEANLVGAMAGAPLSTLIDAMRAGNTYVNVHTTTGVPPANTGPGNYPGGEVRGQIRPLGPPPR
jgi:hypothetical protein